MEYEELKYMEDPYSVVCGIHCIPVWVPVTEEELRKAYDDLQEEQKNIVAMCDREGIPTEDVGEGWDEAETYTEYVQRLIADGQVREVK